MFDIINLVKGKGKSMGITLSEEGKKVLAGVETVVVTGKVGGDTVYVGHREIVLKMQVSRPTYKALKEGDQLFVRDGELAFSKVQPVTETKSNPPLSQFAHRFPK